MAGVPLRHRRLLVPHKQPLCPAPTDRLWEIEDLVGLLEESASP